MRRLHGAPRRPARAQLPRAGVPGRRDRHPHGGGPRAGGRLAGRPAAGVPRDRRRPVRDLHAGDADGRRGVPRVGRRADRRRHPRGDRRQPVPLHGLHEDHRRDPARGRAGRAPDAGRAAGGLAVLPARGVRAPRRAAASSARRRHGPARPAHRRAGSAAGAGHRPVAGGRAARDRHPRRVPRARRAHHVHGHPPLADLPGAPAGARRCGRDDRRGADPAPRHDRGQRDERLAGRRHAAGAARAGRDRWWWAASPASARSRPPSSGPPTAGRPPGPTSCWSGSGSCSGRTASSGSGRWARGAPRRSRRWWSRRRGAGRTRGRTCGSRWGPWPRRRSGSARPRRRSRAGRGTSQSVEAAVDALGKAIRPIDDVRSTAAYRREAARRVVRRLLADSVETT